jgi:hypothetical protein
MFVGDIVLPFPLTLTAALVLASVYILGHKLRARLGRRRWVSIAAGVSVSTIFLDLLPEISESQARFSASSQRGAALFPEQAIYLAVMLGFVLFYGLEYMATESPSGEGGAGGSLFSLRIAAFAGYSGIIAYLLVHSTWDDAPSLFAYSLAMAFHFLLVGYSLAGQPRELYESRGRWILALAVIAGWSIGILTSIPEQWLARAAGFVSGGVIMNSLVVELPASRRCRQAVIPYDFARCIQNAVMAESVSQIQSDGQTRRDDVGDGRRGTESSRGPTTAEDVCG